MKEMQTNMASASQSDAEFKTLQAHVDEVIGVKLFTLMAFDAATGIARRFYSNMPDVYPVSGEKTIVPNDWTEHVLSLHKTFVANSIDEIAAVFPDHELIRSLGCESCINIPVVVDGQVKGTLNCLHEAHHYTPARVAASEQLKEPGEKALQLAASLKMIR